MTYQLTTFDDLKIGQKVSLTKIITEEDLNHFIAITGDENPLHVDKIFFLPENITTPKSVGVFQTLWF